MRLDLGDEQYADLREADKIPRKQARAFRKVLYRVAAPAASVDASNPEAAQAAAASLLQSSDGMDGIEEMAEAMVLAAVSFWTFGDVSSDVLDTIPDSAVDTIYDYCQKAGYIEKLMPDFGVSDDTDSPTTPS